MTVYFGNKKFDRIEQNSKNILQNLEIIKLVKMSIYIFAVSMKTLKILKSFSGTQKTLKAMNYPPTQVHFKNLIWSDG